MPSPQKRSTPNESHDATANKHRPAAQRPNEQYEPTNGPNGAAPDPNRSNANGPATDANGVDTGDKCTSNEPTNKPDEHDGESNEPNECDRAAL